MNKQTKLLAYRSAGLLALMAATWVSMTFGTAYPVAHLFNAAVYLLVGKWLGKPLDEVLKMALQAMRPDQAVSAFADALRSWPPEHAEQATQDLLASFPPDAVQRVVTSLSSPTPPPDAESARVARWVPRAPAVPVVIQRQGLPPTAASAPDTAAPTAAGAAPPTPDEDR